MERTCPTGTVQRKWRAAPSYLGFSESPWTIDQGAIAASDSYEGKMSRWSGFHVQAWVPEHEEAWLFLSKMTPKVAGMRVGVGRVALTGKEDATKISVFGNFEDGDEGASCCFNPGVFLEDRSSQRVLAIHAESWREPLRLPKIAASYENGKVVPGKELKRLGTWIDGNMEEGGAILWGNGVSKGWELRGRNDPELPRIATKEGYLVGEKEYKFDTLETDAFEGLLREQLAEEL